MLTTRQVNTGFECHGLAYADGMLFISDEYTSVYVYTMTGNRLQQFSLPQSNFGFLSRLFNYRDLCSVAVSDSRIYVAHRRKGLIILGRNGELIGEFTDPKLKGAHGICLFRNNSVLVCGEDSNNVLQFTPDGKLIGEVLKRDKGCKSLCCTMNISKLIVGGIGDKIDVYDISW
jgi:outer membrane protein assembly factor BamB